MKLQCTKSDTIFKDVKLQVTNYGNMFKKSNNDDNNVKNDDNNVKNDDTIVKIDVKN